MGTAVLTEEQVLEARQLHTTGKWPFTALALRFDAHVCTLRLAVIGRSWQHLPYYIPAVCEVCGEIYDTEGGHIGPMGSVKGLCPDCE
jgi:hypothetical protein